jgi:hypothetical protein
MKVLLFGRTVGMSETLELDTSREIHQRQTTGGDSAVQRSPTLSVPTHIVVSNGSVFQIEKAEWGHTILYLLPKVGIYGNRSAILCTFWTTYVGLLDREVAVPLSIVTIAVAW